MEGNQYLHITISKHIIIENDLGVAKGNMNIKLRDLCETLIVYILLNTFQLVHISIAI